MVPSVASHSSRGVVALRYRLVSFLLVLAAAGAMAAPPTAPAHKHAAPAPGYADRSDVRRFVDELVRDQRFERRQVLEWMRAARYQAKIIEAMQRPILEPPKWFEYSPRFLAQARIDGGLAFWRANADALERASAQFGVPPEIVVAIIGVETYYGRNLGSHRVIDALSTLAFDYPRRGPFFRGELKEFLLFARAEGISPIVPKGSFAGAMGVPQFMPGSVRRYAIDYDGDGHVDLWNSAADAIGSVANYLARHDWLRGQPVMLPATIDDTQRDAIVARLDGGISERRPVEAWTFDGVRAIGAPDDLAAEPVGVLLLEESADGDASYWVACPNFYVITRYNKSRLYAAAVTALASEVRKAYDAAR
jgi:membrane-bound lytic murein transglycosylase B